MALTDHDTTAGWTRRVPVLQRGVRMLNGIELSSTWRAQTIHVIGLGIDARSAALLEGIDRLQALRRSRLAALAERLERKAIPASRYWRSSKPSIPSSTRTHLARALISGQHVRSMAEAFKRYLGRGGAAHVAANYPDVSEVVPWIRAAGGVAALAHPMRYIFPPARGASSSRCFATAVVPRLKSCAVAPSGTSRPSPPLPHVWVGRLDRIGFPRSTNTLESARAVG